MRPLPVFSPLPPAEDVFDPQTDDFVAAFADDFTSMDSLTTTAASEQQDVAGGLDPISSAIDALGGMMDDASSALDLLTGDLNAVDLAPQILNFQAADAALDNNLNNPIVDVSTFFLNMLGWIESVVDWFIYIVLQEITALIDDLYNILYLVLAYLGLGI
jgi:hypothetical protein